MTMQEALEKQLLGRTIVKVDVEKQYTYAGTNINIKLWFDDGSSMEHMMLDVPKDPDEGVQELPNDA